MKKKIVLIVGILILVLTSAVAILALVRHYRCEEVRAAAAMPPGGIDSLEAITVNGVKQYVLIRGRNKSNPVLLFLHGGPGSLLFPEARMYAEKLNLEEWFTVVYWEQPGTGKSYRFDIPASSMTIERFVADVADLSAQLAARFGVPKIYLLGRSWGSQIGLMAAARFPQRFHAYMGIGQVVAQTEADAISYRVVTAHAREHGRNDALAELAKIGMPPYTHKSVIAERRWTYEFGGVVHAQKRYDGFFNKKAIMKLLDTPEYTLADIFWIAADPFFSVRHLWMQLYDHDFRRDIPSVAVPIFIFAGRHDMMVPQAPAWQFFESVRASRGKEFFWFEHSAHYPELEEPARFRELVLTRVLKR